MAYANITIAPVKITKVDLGTQYNKPVLNMHLRAKLNEDTVLPIVTTTYGKSVEELFNKYTAQIESDPDTKYLLQGDMLLLKPDSTLLPSVPESSENFASIPYIKMPNLIQVNSTDPVNRAIIAGSSNKAPEVRQTASGKTLAKHSFGIYAGKDNGKTVYAYVNFSLFNENYGQLIGANTAALVSGRLNSSFSDKTQKHYLDVVGNDFKKLSYDGSGSSGYSPQQSAPQQSATPVDGEVPF